MPDLFGVFKDLKTNKGFQFWLELKCNKLQKVIISSKQIAWHYAHAKHGGISFVFVKISNPGVSKTSYAIFPGSMIRELSTMGLELLNQGSGTMLPDSWTETDLQNTLTSSP